MRPLKLYFRIFVQPTRQGMRTCSPRSPILHSDIRPRRLSKNTQGINLDTSQKAYSSGSRNRLRMETMAAEALYPVSGSAPGLPCLMNNFHNNNRAQLHTSV